MGKVANLEPRSPSQDEVLAKPGRSQLRNAASGQRHRHRPWSCRLVSHLGTGTLKPPTDPVQRHVSHERACGRRHWRCWSGLQIPRRTARMPWEYPPIQVLRDGTEPSLPRRWQHHFAEKRHGLANHWPTDPQVHPHLANTDDPIAGVVIARWFQPPCYRRRAAQGRGSGRPRPATWVLNRVEDVGPPMPPGPM